MTELSELKKLVLSLSDNEIRQLLGISKLNRNSREKETAGDTVWWFDRPVSALNKDGLALLKELESQSDDMVGSISVDKKQLRYLKQLKKMKMDVPDLFRSGIEPEKMYKDLKSFCISHDLPDEIISRLVPSLVTYIETGYMRPVIFVGEKGCGKTTAVRMIVEEALHIPTEVIKIPQTDGGHGMTGTCGTYKSADAGYIAKARIRNNTMLVAYIFDEIDKVSHFHGIGNIDDELLSITDASNSDIVDNYLNATIVGLEHCPMFATANDLDKVNPILADRCTVIRFPNASAPRIKSILRKYVEDMLGNRVYSRIRFDFELMDRYIDRLVLQNVTSLRKHQQMVETVLEYALEAAFTQEGCTQTAVTEKMFARAEQDIVGTVKRRIGFAL